jgi:hypothetical protein
VAWLPPELEIGEEPELKPPELEPEFVELEPEPVELDPVEPELVPEPEPELAEPELAEPELAEPELLEPELAEEPEPAEAEPELLDALVLCVEPGRARASAPAVTTLAMVTAVVADRTLARPRSLAAWASRIPLSRRALLMSLILRSRTRKSLHEPSGSAMNRAGSSRSCGPRLPRQHEGHLKERLASAHRASTPCSARSPPSATARRTSWLPSLRHRRYQALRVPASLFSQGKQPVVARKQCSDRESELLSL